MDTRKLELSVNIGKQESGRTDSVSAEKMLMDELNKRITDIESSTTLFKSSEKSKKLMVLNACIKYLNNEMNKVTLLNALISQNYSVTTYGMSKTKQLVKKVLDVRRNYESFILELTGSENEKNLSQRMSKFFSKAKDKKIKTVKHLSQLLENNFIIGEMHVDLTPKKFLIENMKTLKENGFTTLFIEHLYYDEQELIDEYINQPTSDDKIALRLKWLDDGFGRYYNIGLNSMGGPEAWRKSNYTALINAAKENGIRVVALDTKYTYEMQLKHRNEHGVLLDDYRIQSFNYTAYHIIIEETKNTGKWFALVGNAHVKKYPNILGISELTGAQSVFIFDEYNSKNSTVSYNHKETIKSKNEKLTLHYEVNVHVRNDPFISTPQLLETNLDPTVKDTKLNLDSSSTSFVV